MKKIILLLLTFAASLYARAQYDVPQNNIWAMGKNSGISFVGSNPVVINTNFEISYSGAYEGCASISDGSNLLFYTNGTTVWNSQGQVMPHGARINGSNQNSASSSQGALIVPMAGEAPSRFYLFTVNSNETGTLFCNVVDLTLNNGLGDIDTTFYLHKTVLKNDLSEKLIAIPGCRGDVWVLVHKMLANVFYAYNVGPGGVDTNAVISTTGSAINYSIGVMKVSPAFNKIAVCSTDGLELFHFDNITGVVSNPYILDTIPEFGYYSCAFSPNGSRLYAKIFGLTGNGYSHPAYQFNLNAVNPMATKTQVGVVSPNLADMQLGPDGKIYFASAAGFTLNGWSKFAGRINNPNNLGTTCNFQDSVTALYFPGSFVGGLPNTVILPPYVPPPAPGTVTDSAICNFPSTGVILHAPTGYPSYLWDNGSSSINRYISQAGVYWVKYKTSQCGYETDTFRIRGSIPEAVIVYNNDMLRTTEVYHTYQWYKEGVPLNGATSQYCTATGNGWYSVRVTGPPGCSDSAAYELTGSTGIADPGALKDQISIYPNPAQNTVSVKTPVPVFISLYSMDGRPLSGQQHQSPIDVHNIAEGLYFIQVRNREGQLLKVEKLWIRRQAE